MEGIGAEVSQKIRSAIKAKLMEIGVYVDEELPDYVMVMVANKRTKDQMDDELQLFLGKHTSLFTAWLHQVLQKLQEVTVANLGNKRKSTDEIIKKKKKTKHEGEKKQLKKKIKVEPEDGDKQDLPKNKLAVKQKKSSIAEDDCSSIHSTQSTDEIPKSKDKTDCKTTVEQEKDSNSIAKANKLVKPVPTPENVSKSDKHPDGRRLSTSSHHTEDLDDEDCINIGTDGELLYTAEEMNAEEPAKPQKDEKTIKGLKKADKDLPSQKSSDGHTTRSRSLSRRRRTYSRSPTRRHRSSSQRHKSSSPSPQRKKTRSRSPVQRHNTYSQSPSRKRKSSSKSPLRRRKSSQSPHRRRKSSSQSPEKQKSKTKYDSQIEVDKTSQKETVKRLTSPQPSALLDDDKVLDARELLNRKKAARELGNKTRSRSKSRDRSRSPIRKRRASEKDASQRPCDDKNTRRVLRESERQFSSRKISRDDDRDWKGAKERDSYSSKWRDDKRSYKPSSDRIASRDERRSDSSKPFKKSEIEERKRSGPLSRVVPRPSEPEDDVDTPVPSVVKVTPRPRRPASQQPSSNLIMKAISEANKSLVNIPLRPDSTQRGRKDSVFSRTLRQLERIPPEKIAVSISNPLALQEKLEKTEENGCPPSPRYDESARNKSPSHDDVKVSSPELDNGAESGEDNNVQENPEEEETEVQESQEPAVIDVQETPDVEACDDELDTQFVVTLNGYDPDGLYSQSELEVGEDEDNDWLKENVEEEPLLISTPKDQSPLQSNSEGDIPHIVINNAQAVNHSNLIEVKPKSTERCKYWPACRLGDKCIFYHPTKPCKLFPACKFGDACLFIHPQCKFNALCTRKDCVFAHTPAHTPHQPAVASKTKVLYAASAVLPCKFYPNCTNTNCQFAHPSRAACRFGLYCTKKDCSFDHHGQVAPVDKLKWTRVSST